MKPTVLLQYCLHLADNNLMLAQRNSEWCGHGPVLEQDIAITNISLDLLGQARNYFQFATSLYNAFEEEDKKDIDALMPRLWKTFDRELNEDDLAFLRDEHQYLNLLLVELPKGDWARTVLRQFFFSAFQFNLYKMLLLQSRVDKMSAIAEKSLKEVAYHLRWSSEWVVRLGGGTEESKSRIQQALEELWPFTGEMFMPVSYELQAANDGYGADVALLKSTWLLKVKEIFEVAYLTIPPPEKMAWTQTGGKEGRHTEHMGYLLAEMQYFQRSYPNSVW